jgi:hypothetical protein
VSELPIWSERVARGFDSMLPNKTIFTIKDVKRNHEIESKSHKKITNTNISVIEAGASHVPRPFSESPTTKNIKKNPTSK